MVEFTQLIQAGEVAWLLSEGDGGDSSARQQAALSGDQHQQRQRQQQQQQQPQQLEAGGASLSGRATRQQSLSGTDLASPASAAMLPGPLLGGTDTSSGLPEASGSFGQARAGSQQALGLDLDLSWQEAATPGSDDLGGGPLPLGSLRGSEQLLVDTSALPASPGLHLGLQEQQPG